MSDSQDTSVEAAAAKFAQMLDPEDGAPEQPDEQDPPQEDAASDPDSNDDAAELAGEDAEGTEAEEDSPQESGEPEPDEADEEEPQLHTVKVNGVDEEVSLEEALKGYSRERDYIQKTEALSAERKELHEAREAAVNEWRNRFQQVNAIVNEFDEKMAQYAAVDWAGLMQSDPDEAARLDLQRRIDTDKRQRFVEAAQQVGSTVDKEALEIEGAKLLARIPEWQNPTLRKEQEGAITAYLRASYQASNTDLASMKDHRIVDISRKAMLYDQMTAETAKKKAVAQKKVAKVPKMSKPGAGTVKRGAKEDAMAQSRNRLRKEHSIDAAANVFYQRMVGGQQ